MIGDTDHDLESTVIDLPCLCIPYITGLTVPSNTAPDNGVTNGIIIYLHLTNQTGPISEQTNVVTTLPIYTSGGLSYGGQVAAYGPRVLPKYQLEGFIDTPCTQIGEYFVSQAIDDNNIRYLYPEIISMLVEGRANYFSPPGFGRRGDPGGWERMEPLWFRDGYGRVFNTPRILDFTASYVEGTPQRMQFSMNLKV